MPVSWTAASLDRQTGKIGHRPLGARCGVSLRRPSRLLLAVVIIPAMVSGCAVVAVADAAVTVAATGVKMVAKTTGAVVDAAIPDDDED